MIKVMGIVMVSNLQVRRQRDYNYDDSGTKNMGAAGGVCVYFPLFFSMKVG